MNAPFAAEVIEIAAEAEGLVRLSLAPPPGFREAYKVPGQYCWLGTVDVKPAPFALLSTPSEYPPTFLVKATSEVGGSLAGLGAGNRAQISLPTGRGFDLARLIRRRVVCVATGTGIAPVRTVIESLLARPSDFGPLSLFYGVRGPSHVALRSDIERWQSSNVRVHLHYSRTSEKEQGPRYIHELLAAEETTIARAGIVVAGQPELIAALKDLCGQLGGDPEQILTNI